VIKAIQNIRIEDGQVTLGGLLDFQHDGTDFKTVARGIYKNYGIDYPKFYKMSALSKLGFLAAELLLKDLDLSGTEPGLISLVLANSSSSLHTDKIYQESVNTKPSPAIFVYTLPNIVIGEICIRNGIMGEGLFFIQEQFDRTFINDYASGLIHSGQALICIAGWVDIDMDGNYLADLDLLK
jgi:hypothetical protein